MTCICTFNVNLPYLESIGLEPMQILPGGLRSYLLCHKMFDIQARQHLYTKKDLLIYVYMYTHIYLNKGEWGFRRIG
jgi:hypothetical protein